MNQNHSEIAYVVLDCLHLKKQIITSHKEDMEKLESSYTTGGNIVVESERYFKTDLWWWLHNSKYTETIEMHAYYMDELYDMWIKS
jgi:hypothetical protein